MLTKTFRLELKLWTLLYLKQTREKNALIIRVVTVEVKSKAVSAQMSFTLVELSIKMIIHLW